MTVTVTCPTCGQVPTEVSPLLLLERGVDPVGFAADVAHDIEWHLEEMMGA